MSPSEIRRLRDQMTRLPDYVRDEIVSQIHELAGRIALRDMKSVLQIIQDLDRVFEPNDE
jgi:hypothetical protein